MIFIFILYIALLRTCDSRATQRPNTFSVDPFYICVILEQSSNPPIHFMIHHCFPVSTCSSDNISFKMNAYKSRDDTIQVQYRRDKEGGYFMQFTWINNDIFNTYDELPSNFPPTSSRLINPAFPLTVPPPLVTVILLLKNASTKNPPFLYSSHSSTRALALFEILNQAY